MENIENDRLRVTLLQKKCILSTLGKKQQIAIE